MSLYEIRPGILLTNEEITAGNERIVKIGDIRGENYTKLYENVLLLNEYIGLLTNYTVLFLILSFGLAVSVMFDDTFVEHIGNLAIFFSCISIPSITLYRAIAYDPDAIKAEVEYMNAKNKLLENLIKYKREEAARNAAESHTN